MATEQKVTDIKLGIAQEDFLTNTKKHLETLYDANITQNTAISNAQITADEAKTIAKGKHKSVVYASISKMIEGLNGIKNETDKDFFSIGDNIYIEDPNVPDFWVSNVSNSYVGTNTENTLIKNNYTNVQFGWFFVSKLETQKVELSKMVESDADLAKNKLVIGVGSGKKVESSGVTISTDTPSETSTDKEIPTSKAVNSVISQTLNTVANTYATKDDLSSAGKVQDVYVNNASVLDNAGIAQIDLSDYVTREEIGNLGGGTVSDVKVKKSVDSDFETVVQNGVAKIDLSTIGEELKSDYIEVPLIDYPNSTSPTHKAVQIPDTYVSFELLNSEGKAVITQILRESGNLYYLLDKETQGIFYLHKIKGNAVNGGSNGGGGNYVLRPTEFTVENSKITKGTLSEEETNLLISNFPNVIVSFSNNTLLYFPIGAYTLENDVYAFVRTAIFLENNKYYATSDVLSIQDDSSFTIEYIKTELNSESGPIIDVMVKTETDGEYVSAMGYADTDETTDTNKAYIDLSGVVKDVTLNGESKVEKGVVKLDGIYTNYKSAIPQSYSINGTTVNAVRFERNAPTFQVFNNLGEQVFPITKHSGDYIYYCFDDNEQYTFREVNGNSLGATDKNKYYQHTMFFSISTPLDADIGTTYSGYPVISCKATINAAKVVRITNYGDTMIKQAITPVNGVYDLSCSTTGYVDITYQCGRNNSVEISGTIQCPIKTLANYDGSKFRIDFILPDLKVSGYGDFYMVSTLKHLEFTPNDMTYYYDYVMSL